jgi:hypothetical protein
LTRISQAVPGAMHSVLCNIGDRVSRRDVGITAGFYEQALCIHSLFPLCNLFPVTLAGLPRGVKNEGGGGGVIDGEFATVLMRGA